MENPSTPPPDEATKVVLRKKMAQAMALHQQGQWAAAQPLYQQVLDAIPDQIDALHLLGVIAYQTHQPQRAVTLISRALELDPDYADAHLNLGNAQQALQQWIAAIASFERALALKPDYAQAHFNRGNALQALKQPDAALASYDRALALKPHYAEACNNRGNTLRDLKRLDEALASYERAIAINPDHAYLAGIHCHTRMLMGQWVNFSNNIKALEEAIRQGKKATPLLALLALTDSAALQYQAAQIWLADKYPLNPALGAITKYARHRKIRVGYFSADFRNHAVSFLAAGLFEAHDKSRFEITAFSYGPDTQDAMQQRVRRAFDAFVDLRSQSDQEIAQLSRSMEIDIAVDFGGFTQEARSGIFSYRAAPIQIHFLGYPGTLGASYIDYLIADKIVVPESAQPHYAEKVAYLPHSYQVNDRQRAAVVDLFSREALGLPRSGFVFCCFNNNYKITPYTFDGWMRILQQAQGSVLLLYAENDWVSTNLKKEAAARGINPERLIFGKPLPLHEYLARYRVADLFLDTLPYNAHTTASDALWAGLPVLTCMGASFAGRVAASLLQAIDLPELITTTPAHYEALAIALATNPERMQRIKQKLQHNRLTTPLFDTALFTRHIEAAYTQMAERYQADLPPAHIHVAPI